MDGAAQVRCAPPRAKASSSKPRTKKKERTRRAYRDSPFPHEGLSRYAPQILCGGAVLLPSSFLFLTHIHIYISRDFQDTGRKNGSSGVEWRATYIQNSCCCKTEKREPGTRQWGGKAPGCYLTSPHPPFVERVSRVLRAFLSFAPHLLRSSVQVRCRCRCRCRLVGVRLSVPEWHNGASHLVCVRGGYSTTMSGRNGRRRKQAQVFIFFRAPYISDFLARHTQRTTSSY